MALLKSHGLISTCYTSANWQDVSSEAYFDQIIDAGALFIWFFHYMPVGQGAAPQLLPTPQQRTEMYQRIRAFRSSKPIFSMDFQNDAEYVGGCIAGGRRYMHINAREDVEPCVFIHYSNVNIRTCSLLDALKSPIFLAYHDNQPFNENMLRPAPCWRTRSGCGPWSRRRGPSPPTMRPRRMWTPSAAAPPPTRRAGSLRRTSSGAILTADAEELTGPLDVVKRHESKNRLPRQTREAVSQEGAGGGGAVERPKKMILTGALVLAALTAAFALLLRGNGLALVQALTAVALPEFLLLLGLGGCISCLRP